MDFSASKRRRLKDVYNNAAAQPFVASGCPIPSPTARRTPASLASYREDFMRSNDPFVPAGPFSAPGVDVPVQPGFIRSNTPSPEDMMSRARYPIEDNTVNFWDDNVDLCRPVRRFAANPLQVADAVTESEASPSTPDATAAASPPSAQTNSPAASSSPTDDAAADASSTQSNPPAPSVVAPFGARQIDMILYLALRGCSKAAIASVLRAERPSKNDNNAPRWERLAAPMIKDELENFVESVGEDEDFRHDAAAIVDRVLVRAKAEDWRNTILVRAADYMVTALPGTSRKDIKDARGKLAKERRPEKMVWGPEARLDESYKFLSSEEAMILKLLDLQDNGVICGKQLTAW